ncbi:MAG: hypothetical protein GY846_00605 [Deltaproteobacteria bacterium]|nr:hypothetical protein [Deltaproteobacteria bacterium]
MEKILEVQDILESIREDNQQLERLIVDLKKEKEPLCPTLPNPALPTVCSTSPYSQQSHGPVLSD